MVRDEIQRIQKSGTGPVQEISFLKALPILGLPMVHVLDEAITQGLAAEELNAFAAGIIPLAAIGPAVFLLCMGYGIAGSRTSPKRLRQQGVQFLLINVILNVFRYLLPAGLLLVFHTPQREDPLEYFLQSDIYYFVGLFFLFYAWMKQLKVSTLQLLLISLGMLSVSTLLTPFLNGRISNPYLASFLGNFLYVGDTSYFPLLLWTIYPTAGLLLGEHLKHVEGAERTVFMRRMLACSAVFLAALVISLQSYQLDVAENLIAPERSINDLPGVLMMLCIYMILCALSHELCLRIRGTRFYDFAMRLSSAVMPFYLLQWILIYLEMAVLLILMPAGSFHLAGYLISVLAVTGICAFISLKWGMRMMKPLMKLTSPRKRRTSRYGKVQ